MFELRPILLINGILLTIIAFFMLIPALVDVYQQNPDWIAFMRAFFITAFIGGSLYFTNRGYSKNLSLRQAFILTTSSWIVVSAFGALPFWFSTLNISYTDAFFETMSGLTTTGASAFSGLDSMPPGILLWRALLHWMGGMGIIVLAIAILPALRIGGMQLFRMESSDKSDKVLPRAGQISTVIGIVYLSITGLCTLLLWMAGMSGFDAFCHAMATVATGGFSTHDASIGYYNSLPIDIIITVFMALSAMPFLLYFQMVRGQRDAFFKDTQVRWFLGLLASCIGAMTLWAHFAYGLSLGYALRHAAFNVTAIITTTGFASTDYSLWGTFSIIFFFMITVMGGCTGSTTGGIKVFRYQVLYQTARAQMQRLIQPHGVFIPRYNGKPIDEETISSVLSFFTLWAFCFMMLTLALSLLGTDYITSMSAVAATMANVGPGLGAIIGPVGNYSSLPEAAKWLLSFSMLIGRLELYTVLVLFLPNFWRD